MILRFGHGILEVRGFSEFGLLDKIGLANTLYDKLYAMIIFSSPNLVNQKDLFMI